MPATTTSAAPRLRVSAGVDKGVELELSEFPVTIGRADDNTLKLQCRSVSRHHVRIERDGDGFKLVDCQSSYGVKLRGKVITSVPLWDGSAFRLGDNTLEFIAPGLKSAADDVATLDLDGADDSTDPVGIPVAPKFAKTEPKPASKMPKALVPLLWLAFLIVLVIAVIGGYFLAINWR